MIVSNEPGYYKAGAYGIRIENLVAVSEAEDRAGGERPMLGFETLTLAPIDRRLVEPSLLTADETRLARRLPRPRARGRRAAGRRGDARVAERGDAAALKATYSLDPGRGRDARYRAPPAQNPACPIKAPGSHLG